MKLEWWWWWYPNLKLGLYILGSTQIEPDRGDPVKRQNSNLADSILAECNLADSILAECNKADSILADCNKAVCNLAVSLVLSKVIM